MSEHHDDPYAPLSPHGILPLVRDQHASAGVRFAVIGRDAPDACVVRPTQLPDAEMTLRIFADPAELRGYVAALAEHGGNAVSVEVAAPGHTQPVALIVRHDRPARSGSTLDDVIALVGTMKGADQFAKRRRQALERIASDRRTAHLAALWSRETDVLMSIPGTYLIGKNADGSHLEFMPSGTGAPMMRLIRGPKGVAIGADIVRARFHDADMPEWERAVADAGMSDLGRGVLATAPGSIDADSVSRAIASSAALAQKARELGDLSHKRAAADRVRANGKLMTMLDRLAQGCVICWEGPGHQGWQLSPVSGTAVPWSGALVREAMKLGLVEHGWRSTASVHVESCPGLVLPTRAGLSFLQGKATALEFRTDHFPAAPNAAETIDAFSYLRRNAGMFDPDALERIADISQSELPADGSVLTESVSCEANPRAAKWTAIAAAALAGRATCDEGRLVRSVAAPTPSR